MDYSKLSDFEINKAVAATLWPKCKTHNVGIQEPCVCVINNGGPVYSNYDPCNNPNHVWPIINHMIFSGGFFMRSTMDHEYARVIWKDAASTDKNPLRSAMIVYLMMEAA